jgi:hypothetical protein
MNNVTLVYTAQIGGASAIAVQALMNAAAVPFPPSILTAYGLRVTSDVTAPGPPTVRTIVLAFGPSVAAVASAVLVPGDASGSPIDHFTTTAGSGYVLPPVVQLSGAPPLATKPTLDTLGAGQAWMKVVGATVAAPGAGYSASTFAVVSPASPGGNRPSQTAAPSNPTSHAAKLTLTILAGNITGVAIADAGAGYAEIPNVLIVDPTGAGSGGKISLSMGVDRIDVLRAGNGYQAPPTVTLTPAFKLIFPDSSDQRKPFYNLMTTALSNSVLSPVVAAPPVLS